MCACRVRWPRSGSAKIPARNEQIAQHLGVVYHALGDQVHRVVTPLPHTVYR